MCCKSRWIETIAVINTRQNDVQRLASTISENLSSVRYELATVQQTVQNA